MFKGADKKFLYAKKTGAAWSLYKYRWTEKTFLKSLQSPTEQKQSAFTPL